jgi:hypothetical protein
MKIILGTNTFKNSHRQNIAIGSWSLLKNQFPNLQLYDIQFKDEEKSFEKYYPDLNTLFNLERSSADLNDYSKKLPFVNDIMFKLSEIDSDYFIFSNSDIIINKNLIKKVLTGNFNALACSRLDIGNINSIDEYINKKINPIRWEIAGFDTFVFKTEWFIKNKYRFNDYFLGKPEFDGSYSFICKVFGGNEPLGNDYPPFCFHIMHENQWAGKPCVEMSFNENTRDSTTDHEYCGIMGDHLRKNLMRRQPWGAFLYPHPEEKEFEKKYFDEIIKKYVK